MKQGLCKPCKVRWEWKRDLPGEYCRCPECGCLLRRTTHLSKAATKLARVDNSRKLPGILKRVTHICGDCNGGPCAGTKHQGLPEYCDVSERTQ